MPIIHVLSILLLVGGLMIISATARRIKNAPPPPATDPGEVAALNGLLGRMEERIATLERILDAEDPKWRGRS
jgi:phage shock protein B